MTGDKTSANILEITAGSRGIAYYDLPNLMMDKSIARSLIANIDCQELGDYGCVSNDRGNLISGDIAD